MRCFSTRRRAARKVWPSRIDCLLWLLISDMVDAGALMASGPNHATLFGQSAKLLQSRLVLVDHPGTEGEGRVKIANAPKV